MSSKSNRNQGVRIIADFEDRAIPLSIPGGLDQSGKASRSSNEGISLLAEFASAVRPLNGCQSGAVAGMAAARSTCTDDEVLSELMALPPLADENDPCWKSDDYWRQAAYPYMALAEVTAARRLQPAIRLLLDRACYGDPGEIMRGLRHTLEAIANPDWPLLADICLEAARSPRLGTRLWSIDELTVLGDPRARPVFEEAIRDGPEEIRWRAKVGLERLAEF